MAPLSLLVIDIVVVVVVVSRGQIQSGTGSPADILKLLLLVG